MCSTTCNCTTFMHFPVDLKLLQNTAMCEGKFWKRIHLLHIIYIIFWSCLLLCTHLSPFPIFILHSGSFSYYFPYTTYICLIWYFDHVLMATFSLFLTCTSAFSGDSKLYKAQTCCELCGSLIAAFSTAFCKWQQPQFRWGSLLSSAVAPWSTPSAAHPGAWHLQRGNCGG